MNTSLICTSALICKPSTSSLRRGFELAAFYKQETKPVSLPLFGPNRNLTVEGRLYRDLHAASVLKISRANEIGSGLRVPEAKAAPRATRTVRRIPATTPQNGDFWSR